MTYPDFIRCPKCKSNWDTRMGHHPDSFDKGICPECGWHLNREYKDRLRLFEKEAMEGPTKIFTKVSKKEEVKKVIRWWKGVCHERTKSFKM